MSAKRLLTALLIGLGVLTIAWLCAQPYFVLGEIRHAAQVGDRDALTELVDFPLLRGSLQASLNAEMAKSAGGTFVDNPVAGPASLAGRAAVDSLVEAYVAPAGIAALTEGRRPDSTVTAASSGSSRSILVEQGYVRPSVFLATVESDSEGSSEITFVLQRRWLSWVLIDVN